MPPVFISYVRQASAEHARALRRALGPDAFLDESEIEDGEEFPARVLEALLDSRVVVLFLDDAYFGRRYCLWELRAALTPFSHADGASRAGALDHVVIALPAGEPPAGLSRLPQVLQDRNWPAAEKTQRIAALVRAQLGPGQPTLRERCARAGLSGSSIRADLLELVAAPPALSLGGLPLYPLDLPPSKGDGFVGRADQLWRIDYVLSPLHGGPADAARIAALEGGGGHGKTQLALEYVHRFGPRRFRGGIFWLDAEGQRESQHHGILRALRPETPDLAAFSTAIPPRDASAELRETLHHVSANARMLFVVDNLPEPGPDQGPAPIEEWAPALGKVAVLTTSRMRSAESGVHALAVETLDQPSAIQLLTRDLRPVPAPRACAEIVEWVGRLPLALTVLNAYLRPDPTLKLPELLTKAKAGADQAGELDSKAEFAQPRVRDPLRGATDAYSCSFRNLSPEGRHAARLLALLGPDPIPVEVVRELKIDVRACDELLDRSFVSRSASPHEAESPVPMYGAMHRVLADFIRKQGPVATAPADVGRALQSVLSRARQARDQWSLIAAAVPHARHVLHDAGALPDELRADLLDVLASCVGGLGRREEAAAASREAVAAYRRLEVAGPGTFQPKLARALNHLSRALGALGHESAGLEAGLESAEIRRRLSKGDPGAHELSLANSLAQLSNCLGALGRRKQALEASREAVEIHRRRRDPESEVQELDLANALHAHSLRLSNLGQSERALESNEEAMGVYRRLVKMRPGAFEPELARALNNLSTSLGTLGHPEKARETSQQAVALYRALVKARPGAFEPGLAMSLGNLANWLRDLGSTEEALEVARESLREYLRLVRTQREAFEPAFALSLNKLSVLLGDLGMEARSLAAIRKAVEIRRRLAAERPDAHEPALADSLVNLSIRQSELGLRGEALQTSREAVAIYRGLADAWRDRFEPDLATALGNLSNCLAADGHRSEGLSTSQEAVAIYRRLATRGSQSVEADLAWALYGLSIRLHEHGRPGDALAASEEAAALYRRLAAAMPKVFSGMLARTLENQLIFRCAAGKRRRRPAASPRTRSRRR